MYCMVKYKNYTKSVEGLAECSAASQNDIYMQRVARITGRLYNH